MKKGAFSIPKLLRIPVVIGGKLREEAALNVKSVEVRSYLQR